MTESPSQGEAVSFGTQIKPLFREKDQQSMSSQFDLWSYDSVSGHADAIFGALRSGKMPCDGPGRSLRSICSSDGLTPANTPNTSAFACPVQTRKLSAPRGLGGGGHVGGTGAGQVDGDDDLVVQLLAHAFGQCGWL